MVDYLKQIKLIFQIIKFKNFSKNKIKNLNYDELNLIISKMEAKLELANFYSNKYFLYFAFTSSISFVINYNLFSNNIQFIFIILSGFIPVSLFFIYYFSKLNDFKIEINKLSKLLDNKYFYENTNNNSNSNSNSNSKIKKTLKYFNDINNKKDIKKRYKELSRKYHPDISTNNNSDIIMKEINEEYSKVKNKY